MCCHARTLTTACITLCAQAAALGPMVSAGACSDDDSDSSARQQPAHTVSVLKFDSIVGCEGPKQALRENVVLPLALPPSVRDAIFTGPRAAGANVLLYGTSSC
jgi:ATP-dependent 26S proteasome regulatory subunit